MGPKLDSQNVSMMETIVCLRCKIDDWAEVFWDGEFGSKNVCGHVFAVQHEKKSFWFIISAAALVLVALPETDAQCTDQWECKNEKTTCCFLRTHWNLTEVPGDIPSGTSDVGLQGNDITSLPPGVFSHLNQCRRLWLQQNQIAAIDTEAFRGLRSLVELDMSFNNIPVLQSGVFTGLESLENLYLSGNKISVIESGTFSELRSLVFLKLSKNHLSAITSGMFTGLVNLTWLDVFENNISSIDNEAFSGMRSLELLFLGQNINSILFIGSEAFNEHITISSMEFNNHLSVITSGMFKGLNNLHSLDISFNPISHIEPGAFDDLYSLRRIYLYRTNLTTLSPDLFLNVPRPLELWMAHWSEPNQWNCNSLCWLKHEEQQRTVSFSSSGPKCADGSKWSALQCGDQGQCVKDQFWCAKGVLDVSCCCEFFVAALLLFTFATGRTSWQ